MLVLLVLETSVFWVLLVLGTSIFSVLVVLVVFVFWILLVLVVLGASVLVVLLVLVASVFWILLVLVVLGASVLVVLLVLGTSFFSVLVVLVAFVFWVLLVEELAVLVASARTIRVEKSVLKSVVATDKPVNVGKGSSINVSVAVTVSSLPFFLTTTFSRKLLFLNDVRILTISLA